MDEAAPEKSTEPLLRASLEELRRRLIDRTRRNRLLNFRHSTRGQLVRVVAQPPDRILDHLVDGGACSFAPLPDPDDPADERTPRFQAALARARQLDQAYRGAVAALDPDDPAAPGKEHRAERSLRDRLRAELGMPPRVRRAEVDLQAWARQHGVDPSFDLQPDESPALKGKAARLQTLLFPDLLRARLTALDRNARAVERETGVKTLHLAFGFLEWFEDEVSDVSFLSPLLLLPVRLDRERVRGKEEAILLRVDDPNPKTNLSLGLRLLEMGLFLPAYDQDAAQPIEAYFAAVAGLTRGRKRWRLRRYVTLSRFSFARIAMYDDLDPRNWNTVGEPSLHPLVRPLLQPGGEGLAADAAEVHDADNPEIRKLVPVLVHDADSSQVSAIADAMWGRSLVIEGPPGTGKSQTIANLIANLLYRGKTVLFISEKMAALEVVKSRLDAMNLGAFCLTLHAAGAAPAAVIERLKERAQLGSEIVPAERDETAQHRAMMDRHLRVVHAEVGPHDESVHALIGAMADIAISLPDLPRLLRARAATVPEEITADSIATARDKLAALEIISSATQAPQGGYARSPFVALERTDLFPDEQDALTAALSRTAGALHALEQSAMELARCGGIAPPASITAIEESASSVFALPDLPVTSGRDLLRQAATREGRDELASLEALLNKREDARELLQQAGIGDPHHLAVGCLGEFARRSASLGLSHVRVADIAGQARSASTELQDCTSHGKTVVALVALLGLAPNPNCAALICAAAAAKLAAEANADWLGYRRAGLAQQAVALSELAAEADRVAAEEQRIIPHFAIEGGSPEKFRTAAETLRRARALGFLSADVRKARRFFADRWRGTRRAARRVAYAEILDEAAALIEAREALRTNSLAVSLFGPGPKLDPAALRLASVAAAWLQRVENLRNATAGGGPILAERLIELSLSSISQLGALAPAASGLEGWLRSNGIDPAASWRDLRHQLAERARSLAMFAIEIAEVGLAPDTPLSAFADLERAHTDWRSASEALAAHQESAGHGKPPPRAELITEALKFAKDAVAAFPEGAERLLADGWQDEHLGVLRSNAEAVSRDLAGLRKAIAPLNALGLSSLVRDMAEGRLRETMAAVGRLLEARNTLPDFLRYAKSREQCVGDRLASVVLSAYEEAGQPPTHTAKALDWLAAWTAVRRQAENNRDVFKRNGEQLDASRRSFAAADRASQERHAKAVRAQALRRIPPNGSNLGHKSEWTEGSLLKNEFAKSKRHVAVRDLLARAGKAVQALAPCTMMSPLTVAQYLRPGKIFFDVVIMDEASQIAPAHAIGALLRSRQAIVVGDSQQLPPTDFFDRSSDDAIDAEAAAEDDENEPAVAADDRVAGRSILDLARSGFQTRPRRLLWHYRSQHESLIAFSNRTFYPDARGDGSLVVFPSAEPASEMLGVELVQVQGTRQNRENVIEAHRVAEAVALFARTHPDRSLGIVTMNIPQRVRIEDELEQLATREPAWERYRDTWNERLEPCFVKNLENVQGDERDAIFISLGWGPTPQGVFHQRFFPVNREFDGPRRLNVLFTRARRKVLLFASFAPEQIRVDDRTPRGPKVLRDYLFYARDGKLPLRGDAAGWSESPFEASVAAALRSRGHDVALQVGVSGYRVDLAVRDPVDPSRYLIGIECDGATYHRAKSARDRDRLREEILRGLGWTHLARVWSTDWFHDPVGQTARLEAAIAQAEEVARGRSRPGRRFIDVAVPPPVPDAPAVSETPAEQVDATARPTVEVCPASPRERRPDEAPDLTAALERFRDAVIFRDLPGSEPERCILRPEMIRYFADRYLDDPEDWFEKIPEWLRSRTDARQVKRYLEDICELVGKFPSPRKQ